MRGWRTALSARQGGRACGSPLRFKNREYGRGSGLPMRHDHSQPTQKHLKEIMLRNAYNKCLRQHGHTRRGSGVTRNPGMVPLVHITMKRLPIEDPQYWRERAEEARRIAEQLADAVAKQTMLDIARSYDNLAAITQTRGPTKPAH